MKVLGYEVEFKKPSRESVPVKAVVPGKQSASKSMDNLGSGSLPIHERAAFMKSMFNTFPFTNYMIFKDTPYWQRLMGLQSLFEWYHSNPVLNAVVSIKSREYANMKIVVENVNTGEIEPESTKKQIPAAAYRLIKNPNPIQTQWEFLRQRKIFREVAGNSFTYGNWPDFHKKDILNLQTLWNVWPAFMQFKLAGNYFEATTRAEIIKEWRFEYGTYKKIWTPEEILHQNEPNTDPKDGLIFGIPKASSLIKPLTNIDLAFESRNVIIQNRGMRGIVSSDKGDNTGKIPLLPDEQKSVEEAMKKYGTLEEQMQFFFTNMPIKYDNVDQDVSKLGLFEEVSSDAVLVSHVFGVPEILTQLDLDGATFENQTESVRRLYQGTLIPEAEDDINGLNQFTGLDQTDWRYKAYWDHIPVLQKSEKEKAESNKSISVYMEKLFMIGGVTMNTWLDSIGLSKIPDGDKTIFELEPEKRDFILRALKVNATLSVSADADQGSQTDANGSQNGKAKKNGVPLLN